MKSLKEKEFFKRATLILICSLVFYVIFTLAATIIVIFGGWFYRNHFYELAYTPDNPYPLIFIVLSLVTGTAVSFCLVKKVFIPLGKLNRAVMKIAKGDYSVRIAPEGIPAIKKLTVTFNKMAEELQNVEILKSDFVNNFSHEFKTPVTSIAGFAEMLKKNLTEEEKEEYINIIAKESRRLAQLSGDVLELTRLDNKKEATDKVTFNLSEQIRLVIALLDTKWADKEIEFNLDCDEVYICANEKLLQQLWVNLIDNAIKFSPDEATVYITLSESGNKIIATVKDEGCGMSEKTKLHAFDRLYRGDGSEKIPGNGIGLTMAKRVCEMHGGKIEIIKTDSTGTTFEVTLNKK